jgi:hypothetical protein
MKITVNEKCDAIYFRLDDSTITESEEIAPGIILDFNENREVSAVIAAEPALPSIRSDIMAGC